MAAQGEEAVNVCQTILDNGRDDAQIYYQLTSQLYQLGRTDEALTTLNKGLSKHKGNSLLTTLQTTLRADTEEQAALRASAKKNVAAMNRGQLKLTCLTKTNEQGSDACRGYLAKTNVDGDKIKSRMADIISSLTVANQETQTAAAAIVPTPSTSNTTGSTDTTDPDASQIPTSPQAQASEEPVAQPVEEAIRQPIAEDRSPSPSTAQLALRERIREVQSQLATLGFDVGIPDGIAGPRTTAAVSKFYQITQLDNSKQFDDQTFSDIKNEVERLYAAEDMLRRSRDAASEKQIGTAIELLALAEQTSPLFNAPTGYGQNLDFLASQQTAISPTEPVAVTPSADTEKVRKPQVTTTTIEATGTSQQLNQVLAEIQSISATLSLRRANNRRQTQDMRDEVDRLFR